MLIKQISVFVENRVGKLAEILSVFKEEAIDIRALSVADTTDFGIFRLIVSDPERAYRVLKEAGCTVSVTKVLAVEVADQPGGLNQITQLMANSNISVEYIYAFISQMKNKAYVILKVNDAQKAIEVFSENQIRLLTEQEGYEL